ncbi:MAG TPA: hypothetical protein VMV69_00920 [Pirellulales bacterium]|nr:hypothetical protein [Pirellulales bacterium]
MHLPIGAGHWGTEPFLARFGRGGAASEKTESAFDRPETPRKHRKTLGIGSELEPRVMSASEADLLRRKMESEFIPLRPEEAAPLPSRRRPA